THLRHALSPETVDADGSLLDRFARHNDHDAFAALLDRHGPMVLGVCRRLLDDPNDADDAFQAVFLALARQAATIRKQTSLASWSYALALRAARRTRPRAASKPRWRAGYTASH